MLAQSAITPEVIAERGYRTVESKAELARLGFGSAQRRTPALVIPIRGVTGEIVLYQIRPDAPRIRNGKPIKYETPAKARMVLDVPRRVRVRLSDPKVPLFVTEGVKKADSAASRGLCTIGVIGVWNWRGTNEFGGKTALADWESIGLNGRQVYIVFDSDVMTKQGVFSALVRLRAFLEIRKARVSVIYLPSGEGGAKVGLDDFFAAGNTVDNLLGHATQTLRPAPTDDSGSDGPYEATPHGLVWHKPMADGIVDVPLTNFNAKVVEDVTEDDGAETRRAFEIEVTLGGRKRTLRIAASQFGAMNWPTEHLGAAAILYPGFGARDHARAAVQMLSGTPRERRVYGHTGWREINGVDVYLHAGGAIGPQGPVPGIEVTLPRSLTLMLLPAPVDGEPLRNAIRASLSILDVAPDRVMVPVLGGVYRAPLGVSDSSNYLAGPTHAGKTEIAAIAQQHYGAGFDSRHLPGSWISTGNSLEGLAFIAKDMLLVIDDLAPTGGRADVDRIHREADRFLRAQGNLAGRGRMAADGSLRATRFPRGTTLSNGEDVPRGASLRGRLLVIDVGPNDVNFARLTIAQRQGRDGVFALSMSGFIRWLASRREEIERRRTEEVPLLRASVSGKSKHRRTSTAIGDLAFAWKVFLEYALNAGAVSQEESKALYNRAWKALGEAAIVHGRHQGDAEPTSRFLDLLRSALASGKAHVAGRDGGSPGSPAGWGWREKTFGAGQSERTEWSPSGDRVGWVEEDDLYIDPDAAYRAAQAMAEGDGLAISVRTLEKRLHERKLLKSTEATRERLLVRRDLEGQRRAVLHLHVETLFPREEPAQPAQEASTSDESGLGDGPVDAADSENRPTNRPTAEQAGGGELFAGTNLGPVDPPQGAGPGAGLDGEPAHPEPQKEGRGTSAGPVGPVSLNREAPSQAASSEPWRCFNCGGTEHWINRARDTKCRVCVPPAPGAEATP